MPTGNPYGQVNWRDGQSPFLFPGLVQMDNGIYNTDQGLITTQAAVSALQSQATKRTPVTNVAALEGMTGIANDEVVVLLGYYTALDGGGGLMRRNAASSATRNGGTIFTSADGGRWERIFPRDLHVAWFGAMGDGTDESSKVNATIDATFPGQNVYLAARDYRLAGIVLKSYMHIYGAHRTNVYAPVGSTAAGVFEQAVGPVADTGVHDMGIFANVNSGQHGLYFNAVAGPDLNGGLWYSTFENLFVLSSSGHCIWFKGGANDFLLPHQLNHIKNVNCWHGSIGTSRALKCTGQCGQFVILNSEFDGGGTGVGTNIELSREFTSGGALVGPNVNYSFAFINTTMQGAKYGMYCDAAQDINLYDPHWEALHGCVDANVTSSVNLFGGAAYDATSDGAGGGFLVKSRGNSSVTVHGTYIGSTPDTVAIREAGSNIYMSSVHMTGTVPTSGMTGTIAAAGTLSLGAQKSWTVTSGSAVSTITSTLPPGETVRLKSSGASVSYNTSGNIDLSGRTSPLSVPSGVVATFVRMDSGSNWHLSGLSNG